LLTAGNYFLRLKEQNIKPKLHLLLGLAVLFWLAGFDVIYSLQDGDFDRKQWLYSIPVRFGVAGALRLSGFFHVVTVIFLALVHLSAHMGVIYWVSFAAVAAVLFGEHRIVTRNDPSRINRVFFDYKFYMSIGYYVTTLGDILLNGRFRCAVDP
jgi:4-hydroxybenzoate polyprenyltransferase